MKECSHQFVWASTTKKAPSLGAKPSPVWYLGPWVQNPSSCSHNTSHYLQLLSPENHPYLQTKRISSLNKSLWSSRHCKGLSSRPYWWNTTMITAPLSHLMLEDICNLVKTVSAIPLQGQGPIKPSSTIHILPRLPFRNGFNSTNIRTRHRLPFRRIKPRWNP